MITKFKLYEELNKNEPEIGDYVICEEHISEEVKPFLHNRIGVCYYIQEEEDGKKLYLIKYKNVPKNLKRMFNNKGKNTRYMYRNEIKYWSKDKEELEMILAAKNFNL